MNKPSLLLAALLVCSMTPLDARADWPQYRGPSGSGVASGAGLPSSWNVETGENVRWHTPIPGLAHSSPVIAGDRIYVATAIASKEAELKVGLYGDIGSANDDEAQEWRLLALDKNTGAVLWNQLALKAIPKVRRHTKASHCNSTPATDGRHIVAILGSEGLFCFDTEGKLLWRKDLGPMNSGYFASPTAQWGFGSSPILHEGKVIVLCDVQKDSFIAAFDVLDGRELWRTGRKDVPTWGTPTLVKTQQRTQLVVNGWHETASYDFAGGAKLWTLDGGGDIPVPTPIFAHGLLYLTSAHGSWRPIRAIRPEATGDITPEDPGSTNAHIAWAHGRKGNYMQTPIVVGDLLFACNDLGILTCFDAKSGTIHFSERLSQRGQGFTASPVSDGRHLYFTSEVGNVFVVAAEAKLRIMGPHPLPDTCMATPAISDGMLIYRTRHSLIALREGSRAQGMTLSPQTRAAKEPPPITLQKPDVALVGEWQGTLTVGSKKLRVRFSIQDQGESMTGTLTSLDQGNARIGLSRVGQREGQVRLEIDEMAARFEGQWNDSKDELKGEWHQSESKLPLVLTRSPSRVTK